MKKFVLAALMFGSMALTGCKQGEHDHCQVDDDCGGSNVCAQATLTCEAPGGGNIDAEVPADSTPMVDAALDAPIDAPDAMVIDAPDAMVIDAPDAPPAL